MDDSVLDGELNLRGEGDGVLRFDKPHLPEEKLVGVDTIVECSSVEPSNS